jgi:hypothetical protein
MAAIRLMGWRVLALTGACCNSGSAVRPACGSLSRMNRVVFSTANLNQS